MPTVPWPDFDFVTFALLFFLTWLVSKILRVGRRESYLPPGPPTIPILGNLHMFPTASPYIKFAEWGQQYGDIYSLKISSGTAIVINSMETATELLDKRGAATADRPKLHMVDKVTGGLHLAFGRYSDTWRVLRKAAHTILTPKAVEKHLPIQVAEATQVLYDFLTNPDDFFKNLGRYSNSVVMSVLFGKRCPRFETHESTAFFEAMELWNLCTSLTAVPPVDLLPFLDYIPERWAWWKGLAAKTRQKQRALYFGLVDECEQRMKRGEENGSYFEEILTKQKELGLDREMIGYLGAVLLEGGTETTTSFLKYLVMALVSFPDVQRKAQVEIDRVVGEERMPSLADVKDLPYMRALIKEIHRFRPVIPLAPHATMTDEEYHGFAIPKGTTIFANTYGILHNPRDFDDPDMFNPDRYLLNEYGIKEGVDPSPFRDNITFGYGRRACPGIHLVENSLNLNTMNLIWAFDFKTAKDSMGNEIPVSLDHYEKNGLLPTPLPFKCQIKPRNQSVVNIVEREFKEATETFVKFERDLVPADKKWVDESRNGL
ncbi:cytochrome [Moniliophthora roreri MCA 2997]|uniref:Tpa: cytochrome n=1 Tax=Moniliophthora roreri (strain MCA 2997) TaxID=1381753 RepID=V2WZH1_MONRO|nr:cytochrome [Moniliophthora roreri MCA 2997]